MLDLYQHPTQYPQILTFPIRYNAPYTIDWLDIAGLTSLENAFVASRFNRDSLLNWDTSRVISMQHMFHCSQYNHPLVTDICWDLRNVQDASYLFYYSQYNHPLVTNICWNLQNLQDASFMFTHSQYNNLS